MARGWYVHINEVFVGTKADIRGSAEEGGQEGAALVGW